MEPLIIIVLLGLGISFLLSPTKKPEHEKVSLAGYLAIRSPYDVRDVQTMINEIKGLNGFDINCLEAECTWRVRYDAMRCVVYAMGNTLSISCFCDRVIIYKTINKHYFNNNQTN